MKSINSFEQEGDVITLPAPYAVDGGDGMAVGALFGIAANKAASGAPVECCTTGVFRIAADSALTGAPGAPAYWDSVNRRCASSGIPIGNLVATKLAGVTVATVRVVGPAPGTVNGDGNVFQTGSAPALKTLAEMLAYAPTTDGVEVYVTDLPSGTRGRFYWHLASSKWRPAGMVLVDRSLTLDSGVNSTAEQYLKSLSIPAGLLFVGAEILFEYTLARSNATDAGGAGGCRIGNAGTISDANFGNGSGIVQLSSSSRTVGNSHRYRVVSATQIEKVGNPATAAASFTSGVTSSSPASWGVGSTTSRLYFAPTVQLAAATGTTLPQVGYCALWLLPS